MCTYNLSVRKVETGRSLGHQPACLGKSWSPGSVTDRGSKTKVKNFWGRHPALTCGFTCGHTHCTCTRVHAHEHVHPRRPLKTMLSFAWSPSVASCQTLLCVGSKCLWPLGYTPALGLPGLVFPICSLVTCLHELDCHHQLPSGLVLLETR